MTFFAVPPILDPSYGSGIFRRRIRLENHGDLVLAGLEDNMHACWLRLHHQDGRIAAVEATWVRSPFRNCGGASGQLSTLVGQPLTASWTDFRAYEDPGLHCTHFHHLLGLAAAHGLRTSFCRQFDVSVPDVRDGKTLAQVQVDGRLVHAWTSDLRTLLAPADIAGVALFRGFTRWAAGHFKGDELEAAYALHMGLFVAGGRRFDKDAMIRKYPGVPFVNRTRLGGCYATQPERFDDAVPLLGSVRDFTDTPDEMLAFLRDIPIPRAV